MAKRYTLSPKPEILKLYGYNRTLSTSPLTLPFPGAMGVDVGATPTQNPLAQMYSNLLQFEEDRALLYCLYDEMELDPTINAYLDQLSEDATQRDARKGAVIWCEARNPEIQSIVDSMLAETGLSDEMAQPIIRQIAKYGDNFEYVLAGAQDGVSRLINYHPASISRVHDE